MRPHHRSTASFHLTLTTCSLVVLGVCASAAPAALRGQHVVAQSAKGGGAPPANPAAGTTAASPQPRRTAETPSAQTGAVSSIANQYIAAAQILCTAASKASGPDRASLIQAARQNEQYARELGASVTPCTVAAENAATVPNEAAARFGDLVRQLAGGGGPTAHERMAARHAQADRRIAAEQARREENLRQPRSPADEELVRQVVGDFQVGVSSAGVGAALRQGANPNVRYRGDSPALSSAVLTGCTECVRLLLEAGADPNAESVDGSRAMDVAVTYGHLPAAVLLLSYGADPSASFVPRTTSDRDRVLTYETAARENGFRALEQLFRHLRRRDPAVEQALATVASTPAPLQPEQMILLENPVQRPRLVQLLCSGVSPRVADAFGYTPLHYASFGLIQDTLVIRTLLDAGADIDARTRFGQTPLMIAVERGFFGVARILIARGADLSAAGPDGRTVRRMIEGNRETRRYLQGALAGGATETRHPSACPRP